MIDWCLLSFSAELSYCESVCEVVVVYIYIYIYILLSTGKEVSVCEVD